LPDNYWVTDRFFLWVKLNGQKPDKENCQNPNLFLVKCLAIINRKENVFTVNNACILHKKDVALLIARAHVFRIAYIRTNFHRNVVSCELRTVIEWG
jgi:hypothetical protein